MIPFKLWLQRRNCHSFYVRDLTFWRAADNNSSFQRITFETSVITDSFKKKLFILTEQDLPTIFRAESLLLCYLGKKKKQQKNPRNQNNFVNHMVTIPPCAGHSATKHYDWQNTTHVHGKYTLDSYQRHTYLVKYIRTTVVRDLSTSLFTWS